MVIASSLRPECGSCVAISIAPSQRFENRIGLLFDGPNLVKGARGMSKHMKFIEGDVGVREVVAALGNTLCGLKNLVTHGVRIEYQLKHYSMLSHADFKRGLVALLNSYIIE